MSGEAEYAIRGGAASRDHAGASASPEWLSMSMIDVRTSRWLHGIAADGRPVPVAQPQRAHHMRHGACRR